MPTSRVLIFFLVSLRFFFNLIFSVVYTVEKDVCLFGPWFRKRRIKASGELGQVFPIFVSFSPAASEQC